MKIHFKYSYPYNSILKSQEDDSFWNNLEITKKEWESVDKKITSMIETVTGLKFQEDEIACYVNTKFSLSDPLTLKIESDILNNIDNLSHELIHVILNQNYHDIKEKWNKLLNEFEEESFATKVHLYIHSAHLEIARMLNFSKERIENIKTYSKKTEYVRTWNIIEEYTPKYFLDALK